MKWLFVVGRFRWIESFVEEFVMPSHCKDWPNDVLCFGTLQIKLQEPEERKKSFLTITRNCANIMWMIFLHFDCILSQTQCNTHAHMRRYHTLSLPSPPNTNAFEYWRVGSHTYGLNCDRSCHDARKLFNNLSQNVSAHCTVYAMMTTTFSMRRTV